MFGLGLPEIVLILVAMMVMFSGGDKVSDVARSLGRATGEFKRGKEEAENEVFRNERQEQVSEIARSIGSFKGEFKKTKKEIESEIKEIKELEIF